MAKFLEVLAEEVLTEDSAKIPEKIQKLLTKLIYKEPFVSKLYSRSHTDYIADSSISTAGVTTKLGRIKFYYNPSFIDSLSDAEMNFLLQHELYHIFRSHGKRGSGAGATTQRLHYLHNIAADCLINADCIKDGGFGGLPMKVIEGAWFIDNDKVGEKYGSVNDTWGKDENDKYNGALMSEKLYKWMLERDKNAQQKQQQQQGQQGDQEQDDQSQGQGQGQPWEPSIGDVVWNKKTKQYGKVTGRSGKNVKVEPISEQEAEAALGNQLRRKDKGDDLWL